MKALVTGHSGFIGRALCKQLQNSKYKVLCWEKDICDFDQNFEQPDIIVHLAGKLNPQEGSWPLFRSNVVATSILAKYASNKDIPFIFFSTAGVYQQSLNPTKIKEEVKLHPDSEYQISKFLAEGIIEDHFKQKGRALSFRLFNPYGPLQSDRFIIGELIKKAMNGETITLKTPESVRDFIFIDDVVSAITTGMDTLTQSTTPLYQVLNLATQSGHSINELANMVFNQLGTKSKMEVLPQKTPDYSIGDITKIKQTLKWSPQVTLAAGLKKMIDYEKASRSC